MVDKTLLDYVEQVYMLESERYTLIQIIQELNNRYNQEKSQIESYEVNKISYYELANQTKKKSCTGSIVSIVFGFVFILGGLVSAGGFCFYFTIAIILIVSGVIGCVTAKETNKENERKNREIAENSEKIAEERLKQVKNKNASINVRCVAIEQKVKDFSALLVKKDKALEKMYSYNIIHKSYKNLYGISKIYELLDTGICDTLTGVNGVYSQMRLNQIIDNQKISIDIMQKLLDTNRLMYDSINNTNNLTRAISEQINKNHTSQNQLLDAINNNLEMQNFLTKSNSDDIKAINESTRYLAYTERQRRLAEGHIDY